MTNITKFFLTYNYGFSDVFTLQLKINNVITKNVFSNTLQTIINDASSLFKLDQNINYQNFSQRIFEYNWQDKIANILLKKPLKIKNKQIDIIKENILIDTNQKWKITPWTNNLKIDCTYKIDQINIPFYFVVFFKKDVDFNEINSSFNKSLKNMTINAYNLKELDDLATKSFFAKSIQEFFNNKIVINQTKYDLLIDDLTVNNHHFFYKDGYGWVQINLFSNSLDQKPFNVEIVLLQSESFFAQIIFNFLKKISFQNPFDVHETINEWHTWYDVISKITEKIHDNKIDHSITNHIHWQAYYGDGTSLNSKLEDDGVESTTDFKNFKLDIFGIKIPRYTLWIKNIFLSDQFKVNNVAKKILLTQITNQKRRWVDWFVDDKVTQNEIGIQIPQKIFDIEINYFIETVDPNSGIISVKVVLKKNQVLKTLKVKIIQFTKTSDLIDQIAVFFNKSFNAQSFSLTSKNSHYDVYKKIVNYIYQILGNNISALREITVYNPDQLLKKTSANQTNIIEIEIKIYNLVTIFNFLLANIT